MKNMLKGGGGGGISTRFHLFFYLHRFWFLTKKTQVRFLAISRNIQFNFFFSQTYKKFIKRNAVSLKIVSLAYLYYIFHLALKFILYMRSLINLNSLFVTFSILFVWEFLVTPGFMAFWDDLESRIMFNFLSVKQYNIITNTMSIFSGELPLRFHHRVLSIKIL